MNWDDMSRRTTALTMFDVAMFDDDDETLRQITLDCSKIWTGETSEEIIEALIEMINKGKDCLKRWAVTHHKHYPNEPHDMASPDHFDLSNCSNSAFFTRWNIVYSAWRSDRWE